MRWGRLKAITRICLAATKRRDQAQKRRELFDALIDMGGLYVKFAQLILLKVNDERSQSSGTYAFLLKKAYDSTPFEDIDAKQVLEKELGDNINQFAEILPHPIAAGSFGQVYMGKLVSGKTVAIKILRPSVLASIDFDMRLLRLASKLLNSKYGDDIDLRQVFGKFESVTRQELDYRSETAYALNLYNKYQGHSQIVIPFTYENLSSGRVITQDYINGLQLTDVLVQKDQGVDPTAYVYQMTGSDLGLQMVAAGQTMLESMLIDGAAHGDPHPGNVMLLPNNQVALLDFGICAQAPRDKQAFFNLVKEYKKIYDNQIDLPGYTWAIMNLFVSELTAAIRSIDIYNHGQFSSQVFDAVNDAIASIYAGSQGDMEELLDSRNFVRIFNSVINEGNRFGLKLEIEQPEFLRATIMFISVTAALGLKREVLGAVYGNVVNNLRGVSFPSSNRLTAPDQAATVIAEWLEKIASKDIYLYMTLSKRINTGGLNV